MAQVIKGGSQRSAPAITTATVTPDAMLTCVITHANTVRQAALDLCYSAAGMIVILSHLTDPKDDNYKSRGDAVDYLKAQIKEQTGVKNRMLDQYVNVARSLADALIGSAKMFGPTIQAIGAAKKPDEVTEIIHTWFDTNRGKKTETMRDLNEALGYAARKDNAGGGNTLTATTAVDRVENLFKQIEKNVVGTGKGKIKESTLAPVVMEQVKDKGDFLVEAIKAVASMSALDAVEKAVKDRRAELKRLSAKAQADVKAAVTTGKKANGKTAKRRGAQHANA